MSDNGAIILVAAIGLVTAGCERAKTTAEPAPVSSELVSNKYGTTSCKVDHGRVLCLGLNNNANLGLGKKGPPATELTPVPGIDDAIDVAVGITHVCAAHKNGEVSCWGSLLSELMGRPTPAFGPDVPGDDESVLQMQPGRVPGLKGVVELVAGDLQTCARQQDGAVVCWGLTLLPDRVASPLQRVRGLPPSTKLFAGGAYVCSLAADRQLYCWGRVDAQWPKSNQHARPTVVFRVDDLSQLEAGGGAICYGDRARCWGDPD